MRSRWSWMVMLTAILPAAGWATEGRATGADTERLAGAAGGDPVDADRLVVLALEAEARGDLAVRARLLEEAARAGSAAAAHSHLGMIDVGTKKPDWKTIDESMAAAARDPRRLDYENVRRQTPDTAAGHLDLARWCLSRGMPDQTRAHLERLLEIVPDHAAARAALGYVRMGDTWVGPDEVRRMQAQAMAKAESIARHRKTLAPLVARLESRNPRDREAAAAAILDLRDPSMIGAMEAALDSPDPFVSKLLVDWMGRVDAVESSLVLARHGLLHPDEGVRTMAIDTLVTRPLHDFVPELLGMLSSPITMMIEPVFAPDGRFDGYRQAFAREGMHGRDVQVVDHECRYEIGGGDLALIQVAEVHADAMFRRQALAEAESREEEVQRRNALIEQVNGRIAAVISRVSGRLLAPVATDMWQWWDAYNETEYQKYKVERVERSYSSSTFALTVPDPYPPTELDPECFVAGTPVVTRSGLKAIETILPGDMVLNRDLATGGLRWKPVLRATTRPPAATIAITLAEAGRPAETFRCSTGHLFWVSGKGWRKANELRANEVLHAAGAPVRIAAVEPQPIAPTYNLEVADAPNYFVGRAMILSHDVTPRRANRQAVPGQDHAVRLSDPRPVPRSAGR